MRVAGNVTILALLHKRGTLAEWLRAHAWLVLWLFGLAHLITYALVQPVWSRVDEAQHFHYVQYLAENVALPVAGETFISRKVVNVSLAVDQWFWNPPHSVEAPLYLDPVNWQRVPTNLEGEERLNWIAANLWYFSYEAMQPPLYYALGAAFYRMLPDGAFLQIYVLRILSATIASLTVLIAYAAMREAFPKYDSLAIGVAASVSLLPGFVLNLSQVTNDSLATTLSALAYYLLVRGVRRGLGAKISLLIGLVIGLSLLTKLTTVYLIPVALVAVALAYAGGSLRPGLLQAVRSGIAVVVTPLVILAPWLARNWLTYGEFTGSRVASELMGSIFRPVILDSTGAVWSHLRESFSDLETTFWFGEPFPPWRYWEFSFYSLWVLSLLALPGIAFYLLRLSRGKAGERRVVLLLLAGMVIHLAEIIIAPVFGGLGAVGRYLYPSVVPLIGLLWLGLQSLAREEAHRTVLVVLVGGLVVLDLVNLIAYVFTGPAG